jgi:signal transduction histidine kinase/ligand-binding sensor domain-containing protein/CheY-like chemotaxis protein/AraC-like DNA-binding protein
MTDKSDIKKVTWLLLCVFMVMAGVAQPLKSRRFSVIDGLPSNTINAMLQDEDGFLWLGGMGGLCRFDGYSVVELNNLSAIPGDESVQNIGQLEEDHHNRLLWAISGLFSYGCYDLQHARFVEFTGCGDQQRRYNNHLLTNSGMWMYNDTEGARHIRYSDGKFSKTDFNRKSGNLPFSQVSSIAEDAIGNTWLFSLYGLASVDVRGHVRIVSREGVSAGTASGRNVLTLTRSGMLKIYSSQGKLIVRQFSPVSGPVTHQMMYQGQWLIFTRQATYAYHLQSKTWSQPIDMQIPGGLPQQSPKGYQMVANKSGNLWIFPEKGAVRKLNLIQNIYRNNEREHLFFSQQDAKGNLVIATYGGGLYIYNPRTGVLQHISSQDEHPLIMADYLNGVLIDKTGCIWVNVDGAGITCISRNTDASAQYLLPAPQSKEAWANRIRGSIYRNKAGDIAFTTKDNQLYHFHSNNNTITKAQQLRANVFVYYLDAQGHEWIGTRGDGLYIDGQRYANDDARHYIPVNDIFDIQGDASGRVWIGTWDGGLLLATYTPGRPLRYQRLLNGNYDERRIHDIECGPKGQLFVGTYNGLYYIDTRKRHITDKDMIRYSQSNGMLPSDDIECIKMTKDGTLWLGVLGHGLLKCSFSADYRMLKYQRITRENGLSGNNIYSLLLDKEGDLWAGSEEGISQISSRTLTARTYNFGNQVGSNEYTYRSSYLLSDGRLLFGTSNGLAIITPHPVSPSVARSVLSHNPPTITNLQINGNSIYRRDHSELLDGSLSLTDHITLKSDQRTISIYYSSLRYDQIPAVLYQYKLEGADQDWQPVTSINHADYNNLSPGTYTFHVRTLLDMKWSPERILAIKISQPWYNTGLAWLIYLCVIVSVGTFLYRQWRRNFDLKQKMSMESQLTEFKLDFFTHITHEFRTPLAIIQNAITNIRQAENLSQARGAIATASRGTGRLLRLVNQLMEFRRMNTGNIRLQVQRDDIVKFVHQVYLNLWQMAKQKDQNLTFMPFEKQYFVAFDHEMLEAIVYNLLSNAIKYADEKGNISLRLQKEEDKLLLTVEDDGPGIPVDKQRELFQPFMHGYASQGGMGIGLYNAHGMAVAHHGSLMYHVVSSHGGSRFTLTLPATDEIYAPDEYAPSIPVSTLQNDMETDYAEDAVREPAPESINDATIVIIEDDADMMDMLTAKMSRLFRVKSYYSGKAGYEGVLQEHPALLICDVMLPDMNGYDIVKRIKQMPEFMQIPVIMLTALDDEAHQIRGYKAGADDYMVKPCNFNLLQARVAQLIKWNQLKMQSANSSDAGIAQPLNSPAPPPILADEMDKRFKEQLDIIISNHISDQNMSIDDIATMMQMGHTKFYGRVKDVTGVPPNKYIMDIRMRLAADMLLEGKYNINEISNKLGFSDNTYFNKCFKTRYGMPPSKYGKK